MKVRWVRGAALGGVLLGVGCAARPVADAALPAGSEPELAESTPGVFRQGCTPSGAELCFNAHDDNCNGLIEEGCGVRTGLVQFIIAWNLPRADVDLRVLDPHSELAEVGRKTRGGLVKEQDCPGRNQDCHGQNYENVYLEDGDPSRGTYIVRVRLETLGGDAPPAEVMLGARIGQRTYGAGFSLEAPEAEQELQFRLR